MEVPHFEVLLSEGVSAIVCPGKYASLNVNIPGAHGEAFLRGLSHSPSRASIQVFFFAVRVFGSLIFVFVTGTACEFL